MSDGLDTLRRRVNELAQDRPELERVASECDLYGHDYQVREGDKALPVFDARPAERIPVRVFCSRCGKSWKVER